MSVIETIDKIITFPLDYHKQNKSPNTLIKESGYLENYDKINEDVIYENLILNPGAINDWIQFMWDKPTGSGWALDKKNEEYIVCYFVSEPSYKELEKRAFDDIAKAYAAYVKGELEWIRGIYISTSSQST